MPFQKEVFVFYLQFLVDYVCFWKSTTICTLSLSEYLSSILQFQPRQKVISFSYNMDTSGCVNPNFRRPKAPQRNACFSKGTYHFGLTNIVDTATSLPKRDLHLYLYKFQETKPETLLGRHAKDGPKLYYKQLTAKTY